MWYKNVKEIFMLVVCLVNYILFVKLKKIWRRICLLELICLLIFNRKLLGNFSIIYSIIIRWFIIGLLFNWLLGIYIGDFGWVW